MLQKAMDGFFNNLLQRRLHDLEGDLCDSDRAEIVRHGDGGNVYTRHREYRNSLSVR